MKLIQNLSDVKIKKKKFSKHKKSYQRKHIDISDIYDAQDSLNREERVLDALGSVVAQENNFFTLDVGEKTSNKSRKSKDKSKSKKAAPVLKCHKYLNGLPGAKNISKKKASLRATQPCKIITAALKQQGNTKKAAVLRTSINRQAKVNLKKRKTAQNTVRVDRDLWSAKKSLLDPYDDISKTYVKDPLKHYEVATKKHRQPAPKHYRAKPSDLKAIPTPAAGTSYNPTLEAHSKLVKKAAAAENTRLTKIKKEYDRYKNLPTKVTQGISFEQYLNEMSEGLPSFDSKDDDEEQTIPELESEVVSGKSKIEKRTKKSRKKATTVRVKEQKRLQTKQQKKQENIIENIPQLRKQLESKEEELKKRETKRQQKLVDKRFRPLKLSKQKYEEPEIAVALTEDEMAGSIRKIQPLSNPLLEHFKSYQKRSIIEVRSKKRQKKRGGKFIKKKGLNKDMNSLVKSLLDE